jgi:hypothetical protein
MSVLSIINLLNAYAVLPCSESKRVKNTVGLLFCSMMAFVTVQASPMPCDGGGQKAHAYCGNVEVLGEIEKLKQILAKTLRNPKFDDQESIAIGDQHSVWLTQLFAVCRDSKTCLLQAIRARINFLTWANHVQGSADVALVSPEQIATMRKSTVVSITNGYGLGSGVVVGKQAVLTNCHVADEIKGTIFTDSKGRTHTATRTRGHGLFDLCLFTVPTLEAETIAPSNLPAKNYTSPYTVKCFRSTQSQYQLHQAVQSRLQSVKHFGGAIV